MNTLLISYDLISPETREDYEELIDYIKSFAYTKVLYSAWLIKTDESCSEIRDEIKTIIDDNDRLFIVDVTGADWASYNISDNVTSWMKENL